MITRNSRGDTLIEVTLALTILSLVLISAYAVASRAFKLGQEAQIRLQVSARMAEQADELRNLRDNSANWKTFLDKIGVTTGPLPTSINPAPIWLNLVSGLPQALPGTKSGPANSTIGITGRCSEPAPGYSSGGDPRGDSCDFIITGNWPSSRGVSSPNTAVMTYTLVNNKLLQPENQ